MPEPASASADLARLRIARDDEDGRSGSAFTLVAVIGGLVGAAGGFLPALAAARRPMLSRLRATWRHLPL